MTQQRNTDRYIKKKRSADYIIAILCCSNKHLHRDNLDALRVVVVLGLAGGARLASSGASVTLTTALLVLLDRTAGTAGSAGSLGGSSSSGLDDG